MHRFSLIAASAAFALSAAWPMVAAADDGDDVFDVVPPSPAQDIVPDTTFDLGIDVRGVAHNPAAVHAFIVGLGADTQIAIMGACATFMEYPVTAQSPETSAFCANSGG